MNKYGIRMFLLCNIQTHGWLVLVAFTTLGIQVATLIFFLMASEPSLQDDKITYDSDDRMSAGTQPI